MDFFAENGAGVFEPQAHIRRDLVVATARGVEFGGGRHALLIVVENSGGLGAEIGIATGRHAGDLELTCQDADREMYAAKAHYYATHQIERRKG